MALVNLDNISISYGGEPVIAGVDLQIETGERIALVGRNGSGKSTLLKLLCGQLEHDSGEVTRMTGLRTASLSQAVAQEFAGSIYDTVAAGLGEIGSTLAQYHHCCRLCELQPGQEKSGQEKSGQEKPDQEQLDKLHDLQHVLELNSAWSMHQEIVTVLSRMSLPEDLLVENLSAGMKRRVLLARALVSRPDLLLLDEPTNHLDLQAIVWLEEFLLDYAGTLLFVTHDRAFLRRLSTRIVEIDRGHLSSWQCDYDTFVERKADVLAAETRENRITDKRQQEEERWARQGVKGRRARNEGRRRALEAMREQRRARKNVVSTAKLQLQGAPPSGRLVTETKNACFAYDDNVIIDNFTTKIMRGDKIGIIGPNGSGKSTLLKMLLGELAPQSGEIRQGTRLEIAYFDQLHAQLDPNLSVQENVAGDRQMISVNGRDRHILGYLQDFLFTPHRARGLVSELSGGERNRVLLARLMTKPSNLLVLDEPTNDLDAETLELLEDMLVEYTGTVLLVSHDRAFLNNVVTSVLVLEGDGKIGEYVGGYEDWQKQSRSTRKSRDTRSTRSTRESKTSGQQSVRKKNSIREKAAPAVRKLTFKEQHELKDLPALIETMEARQSRLHEMMAGADFYKKPPAEIVRLNSELKQLQDDLEQAYERWEELETRNGG